mmetsp:Transcript_11358/g.32742  ORF Transcript_11358/g.32742 Transcript_11358/m.32742 type:complete len:283 (+) Transcript_11358:199-1047(+)
MVDSSNECRAACFGPGYKMDRHDTLDPFSSWEVQHIVPSGIAACTSGDVLLRHHGLHIDERIRGWDYKELIDKWLDIVHTSFEVVNGVLVLQLEVTFVIVDTCNDVASEFSKGLQHILVTSVEQIEAPNGVNLAVLPTFRKARFECVHFNDELINSFLQSLELFSLKVQVAAHDGVQTLFTNRGSGALVELLQNLGKGSLVELQKFQEELQLTLEGNQRLFGVNEVLEMLRLSDLSVFVLEPFEFSFNGASLGQTIEAHLQVGDTSGTRVCDHGLRVFGTHA